MEGRDSITYDIIVIGAGHAGCEAALAAARMGCRTLLLTISADNVALMPCNPSVGGPAKGHVVREIDALGGEMGRNIDRAFIQIRMLNTGKGPAVQSLRAQADKGIYSRTMKRTIERQARLDLKQALVEDLLPPGGVEPYFTVRAAAGLSFKGRSVVVTAGTSLSSRVIIGDSISDAGRCGEAAAHGLSRSLKSLGFSLGRLKTGTPPRVDARTIDFSRTSLCPGSDLPLYFSFQDDPEPSPFVWPSNPVYPPGRMISWRSQMPCYMVYTNTDTHRVIAANLHRAPLFSGIIKGVGPRTCPSIEDKVHKFPERLAHPIFLEPEGWETGEVYVQGANTSLPEDVQLAMLRTMPALERAEIVRLGYAIEYDFVPPSQIQSTLESRLVPGLFLAGQVNGTTGYEEAAAQGLMAGINAVLKLKAREPLLLRRDQAYIGVMIDDLVTRDLTEPYRLLTSRAEYRLMLRHGNADLRLSAIGHQLGLISDSRYEQVEKKRHAIEAEIGRLSRTFFTPAENGEKDSVSALAYLRRPSVHYRDLPAGKAPSPAIAEEIEIQAKYAGYIDQQAIQVDRVRRLESKEIPPALDYAGVPGLRTEARQKLGKFRPATLGQASRIEGVTAADVAILLICLERRQRSAGRGPACTQDRQ